MKLGVLAPQMGWNASAEACRDVAQAAEDLGYASVWTADHVVMPKSYESEYPFNDEAKFPVAGQRPFMEMFTTLGYLAAVTTRVELGVSVCVVPYRHPSLLAKSVATVDQLSEGRFILGAGAGWLKEEFDALGMNYRTRGRFTDEALDLMEVAFGEDQPVSFKSELFELEDVYFAPGPWDGRKMPVWVGGVTPPAIRRTARYGSMWFPHLFGADPDMLRQGSEQIAAQARELGRSVEIGTAMFLPFELSEQTVEPDVPAWRKKLLVGTAEHLQEVLDTFAEVGVEHVLLAIGGNTATKLTTMEAIARELNVEA
jgi:probable F420-dependent oxidoreductase